MKKIVVLSQSFSEVKNFELRSCCCNVKGLIFRVYKNSKKEVQSVRDLIIINFVHFVPVVIPLHGVCRFDGL